MPLSDFQTLIDNLVRDDDGVIITQDRDDALALAVSRYSGNRPRTKVEDIVADGTKLLPLPAAWETDFSTLESLEYPIGDFPPTLFSEFEFYESPAIKKILIPSAVISGQNVRATYTIAHVLSSSSDTIPVKDQEAVSCYAAAVLCQQLASYYSGDSDSTIAADNVDHGNKARSFANRSKELKKEYFNLLGIDEKKSEPAGVVVDMDRRNSIGGERIFHKGRNR